MVSKGFPNVITSGRQYNIGEKPSVILYTYINLHAGTPKPHPFNLRVLDYSVVIWSYMLALVCFYCLCVFVYVLYFIATMSFAGYFLPVLFCMLSMLISDSRLIWFGSVYLVTTAGFVADQLM